MVILLVSLFIIILFCGAVSRFVITLFEININYWFLFVIASLIVVIVMSVNFIPKLKQLDADNRQDSLLNDKTFTFFLGVIALIVAGVLYQVSREIELPLSYEGFAELHEKYEPLINISSALIILLGVVSLVNRSELTSKQLNTSNKQYQESVEQNQFSNYFKHLEEFEKHLSKLNLDNSKLNIESVRMLHGSLFSTFKNFHYEFPIKIKDKYLEISKGIYTELYQVKNNRYYLTKEKALNLMNKVNWLNDTFYLTKYDDYNVGLHSQVNTISYYIPKTYKGLFSLIKDRTLIIMHILEFSYTEKFPDYLKALQSVELNWADDNVIEFLEEGSKPAEALQLFLSDCGADGNGEIIPEKDGSYGQFATNDPTKI